MNLILHLSKLKCGSEYNGNTCMVSSASSCQYSFVLLSLYVNGGNCGVTYPEPSGFLERTALSFCTNPFVTFSFHIQAVNFKQSSGVCA